jgi:hypothetical protein
MRTTGLDKVLRGTEVRRFQARVDGKPMARIPERYRDEWRCTGGFETEENGGDACCAAATN